MFNEAVAIGRQAEPEFDGEVVVVRGSCLLVGEVDKYKGVVLWWRVEGAWGEHGWLKRGAGEGENGAVGEVEGELVGCFSGGAAMGDRADVEGEGFWASFCD